MQKQPSQIVTFVIDKDLDIKNHFIALNAYKQNKERGVSNSREDSSEALLLLKSEEEKKVQIEKTIAQYYKKEERLQSLADDINKEWVKIEKDVIKKLEEIHKFPFQFTSIRGVLSSANRCGYNTQECWFATSMRSNKFLCIDVATHELMHFMFHKYYEKICYDKGLNKDQIWHIKESFSVLLNIEFMQFRFQQDFGKNSPTHLKLREIIKNSWEKNHDFNKCLDEAIDFVKTIK